MPTKTLTCEHCGKEYERYIQPSRVRAGEEPRFCSRQCCGAFRRNRSVYRFTCEQCGKQTSRYTTASRPKPRFCSKNCWYAWRANNMDPHEQYDWTEERDDLIREAYVEHDTATEALDYLNAHKLFREFPFWIIKYRAQFLGCTKRVMGSEWTDEEDRIIFEMVGNHRVTSIAKALRREGYQRSVGAVGARCRTLGYSTRYQGALTSKQVADAFGCDEHKVRRWIDRGLLHGRQPGGEYSHWAISDRALKDFVIQNPLEVSRTKPDIVWLIDLLS